MRNRITRQQYTLIELLTVIAIIGLLAALLLSALSTAKEFSQGMACRSNLRQMGIAFALYTASNNREMPASMYNWLPEYQRFGAWSCGYQTTALKSYMNGSDTALNKIFKCPGMRADQYAHCYKIGYCWFYGKLETTILRPAKKVYATDGTNEILHGQSLGSNQAIYSYGYIPGAGRFGVNWMGYENSYNNQRDFYEGRHAMTVNALYYDGHIEQLSAYKAAMEYHSPTRKVNVNGQKVTSDNDAYDNFFRPQNPI